MDIAISGTGLVQKASVAAITDHAGKAREDGFTSYAIAEHPTGGFDALTVLALVGRELTDMRFATAIVPTFPRHPMVLAGQARTVADALHGRLTLGIGLSHAVMMADLGLSFEKPIRHLREYLSILVPLLETGSVDYRGETLSCAATLFSSTPEYRCPVVVAALGPQALRVAGALADGTTLAWVGRRTIREHIVPRIRDAAAEAGRPDPMVVASLPVCVTNDERSVREAISRNLAMYGQLPSYRAMFEREGVDTPGEVALVGTEDQVLEALEDLRDAGVTEFVASEYAPTAEDRERTRTLLVAAAA